MSFSIVLPTLEGTGLPRCRGSTPQMTSGTPPLPHSQPSHLFTLESTEIQLLPGCSINNRDLEESVMLRDLILFLGNIWPLPIFSNTPHWLLYPLLSWWTPHCPGDTSGPLEGSSPSICAFSASALTCPPWPCHSAGPRNGPSHPPLQLLLLLAHGRLTGEEDSGPQTHLLEGRFPLDGLRCLKTPAWASPVLPMAPFSVQPPHATSPGVSV